MAVPQMAPRDEMLHKIMAAQQLLIEAKNVAITANTLASQVPAVQRLEAMGKECGELMRHVARMQL